MSGTGHAFIRNLKTNTEIRQHTVNATENLRTPRVDISQKNAPGTGSLAVDTITSALYVSSFNNWQAITSGKVFSKVSLSGVAATGAGILVLNNVIQDPAGLYNTSTGQLTIPANGTYNVNFNLTALIPSSASGSFLNGHINIDPATGSSYNTNFHSAFSTALPSNDTLSVGGSQELALNQNDILSLQTLAPFNVTTFQGSITALSLVNATFLEVKLIK